MELHHKGHQGHEGRTSCSALHPIENSFRIRAVKRAAIITLLTVFGARSSWAACLVPPPPCEAVRQSSIVLVADVLASWFESSPIAPNVARLGPQRARLRPLERFKGPELQAEIIVWIPLNSETVVLDRDVRYLIYATELNGQWQTTCRTKPVTQAAEELKELRQCSK
jgi:hypothetical protein